jgi:hypothetical protein
MNNEVIKMEANDEELNYPITFIHDHRGKIKKREVELTEQ